MRALVVEDTTWCVHQRQLVKVSTEHVPHKAEPPQPCARAARIYNKHLDALCDNEPLCQMVLRNGDITWFDPNWYQTVRGPLAPTA